MSYLKNFVGTEKRVRIIHGKRAIRVRAVEVILYVLAHTSRRALTHFTHITSHFNPYALTHFRLNRLPSTIYIERFHFSFRYVRICDLDISREKWLNYLQTVAFDPGLHCLPNTLFWVSSTKWVNLSMRQIIYTFSKKNMPYYVFEKMWKNLYSVNFYNQQVNG